MTKSSPPGNLHAAGRPVTILTYHHFAASDGQGTRNLGITTHPDRLANQLDYLKRNYNIISLDSLLAGELPDRALLITIDDAYRSVYEVAAPIFAERKLPAVLFVNPRPVTQPFVPTDIVLSLLGGPTAMATVSETIAELTSRDASNIELNALPLDQREAVKKRLIGNLGTTEPDLHRDLDLFLTPEQLKRLPGLGIEVANHTMSHTLCRTLTAGEHHEEIVVARDAISELTEQPVRAFAFPWGQTADATPSTLEAIRNSGHQASFLMHGLANDHRPAADIWYRSLATNETSAGLVLALKLKPRLRALWRGRPSLPPEQHG